MNNLIELYNFLDNCNTETLLLKISELIQNLNDQFGDESDLRILNHRNSIKNLYKLIDHLLEKSVTGINDKKVNMNTKNMNSGKSIIEELSDSIGKNEHLSHQPSIDQYKNMDSGDIDFVCSILPYRKNYIRELCRNGDLPYEKPKGKYIFNRLQVEKWKKQHGSESKMELLQIGKSAKSSIGKKGSI